MKPREVQWTYHQNTGELTLAGEVVAHGYSGRGEGRNNSEFQFVRNVGPIPAGLWMLGDVGTSKGPLTIRLHPCAGTETKGRSGFLIHGDNAAGDASHGCIILPRYARSRLTASTRAYLIAVVP